MSRRNGRAQKNASACSRWTPPVDRSQKPLSGLSVGVSSQPPCFARSVRRVGSSIYLPGETCGAVFWRAHVSMYAVVLSSRSRSRMHEQANHGQADGSAYQASTQHPNCTLSLMHHTSVAWFPAFKMDIEGWRRVGMICLPNVCCPHSQFHARVPSCAKADVHEVGDRRSDARARLSPRASRSIEVLLAVQLVDVGQH